LRRSPSSEHKARTAALPARDKVFEAGIQRQHLPHHSSPSLSLRAAAFRWCGGHLIGAIGCSGRHRLAGRMVCNVGAGT